MPGPESITASTRLRVSTRALIRTSVPIPQRVVDQVGKHAAQRQRARGHRPADMPIQRDRPARVAVVAHQVADQAVGIDTLLRLGHAALHPRARDAGLHQFAHLREVPRHGFACRGILQHLATQSHASERRAQVVRIGGLDIQMLCLALCLAAADCVDGARELRNGHRASDRDGGQPGVLAFPIQLTGNSHRAGAVGVDGEAEEGAEQHKTDQQRQGQQPPQAGIDRGGCGWQHRGMGGLAEGGDGERAARDHRDSSRGRGGGGAGVLHGAVGHRLSPVAGAMGGMER